MKKGTFFIGFAFTSLLGTLLHFVFEWSGNNRIVAVFSAVNESTAEHLKLLFWPAVLMGVIEFFWLYRKNGRYFSYLFEGILLGLGFITAFFYTYQGVIGRNIDWLNIVDFLLGVFVMRLWQWHKLNHDESRNDTNTMGILGLLVLAAAFALFTFYPPHIGLFLDPANLKYGIAK